MTLTLAALRTPPPFSLLTALLLGACAGTAAPGPSSPPQEQPDALPLLAAPPVSAQPSASSAAPSPVSAPRASAEPSQSASAQAAPVAAPPVVEAPPCGSLASGFGAGVSPEKAKAMTMAYYKQTLRPRVRAWASETLAKREPGSVKVVREMALQAPTVGAPEAVPETAARATLGEFANKAHRVLCRAAAVGNRPQWRVNLYTELRSPPHPTDIGMTLEVFVDAASGEVLLVVYGPLMV